MHLRFPPYKAAARAPFFSVESREMSSKKLHILIDACKAPASASPFFFAEGDKRLLKTLHHHLDECYHVFYEWPLN